MSLIQRAAPPNDRATRAGHAGADRSVGRGGRGSQAGAGWLAGLRREDVPEPFAWEAPPSVRARVWRAVSAPTLVVVTVFLVAVLAAVALVWIRPHDAPMAAEQTGLGPGSMGVAGAAVGPDPVDADPAPPDETGGAGAGAFGEAASGGAEGAGRDGTGRPTRRVFVHVVGEVRAPGVVELAGDARVEAAITAAGGATERAVLSGVNLARRVVDGEQIAVPDAAGTPPSGPVPLSGGAPGLGGGPVDLNTADAAALETLPRVGPALARRILERRETSGPFTSVEQLLDVPGIGGKTLDGLRELVVVR